MATAGPAAQPIRPYQPDVLPRPAWEAARAADLARLRPLADDRTRRASRGEKHPVHDFLFEYYSFRPAPLLRWTPGAEVLLEGAAPGELGWNEFVTADGGVILLASTFPVHRVAYLRWAAAYLDAVAAREPSFACLGLHEWAMVYRDPNLRHPYVPLRLSRADTDAFVESQPLRCTHYDAFRFFTPDAAPRNRLELTRAAAAEHDQPGCIHVTMDLYRFAYKVAPFGPSAVLADAFELAAAARAIDMRASPYDLTGFGYAPIRVETKDGREEYVEHQRALAVRAAPVRERVRAVYARLLAAVPG
ncbi:MAG TPA: 3-methyladenine DNA glycosylase [Urbifossiella sp.]|nr:3-methyladenine DNA glycosylase [Urbifossiella sp.]